MYEHLDYIQNIAILGGVHMILALGLNLINGACGQFSLGHAGFFAVGAYIGASYGAYFALPVPPFLNLFVSCILGFIFAALSGLLVGVPCLRLKGDYLAIATLGFGEIIRLVILNMDSVGGARGFTDIPQWTNIGWVYLWVFLTVLIIANILRGTHGRAIIGIREDEIAAESMGIFTFKYKVLAFVIGAGFAGLAGALFAHHSQFIHPTNFTFMQSVLILLMIILGGLGSQTGAIVGALIITALLELLRNLGTTVSEWRMVIFSLLLIALMLFRPTGIFGKHELNILGLFSRKKETDGGEA